MKKSVVIMIMSGIIFGVAGYLLITSLKGGKEMKKTSSGIALPEVTLKGTVSIEEAIKNRRSKREYKKVPLTLAHISQLLWAAQGITSAKGLRAAPSAGALYPVEVYLVAGDVQGLEVGVYKHKRKEHVLEKVVDSDVRKVLSDAALSQAWVKDAPAVLVLCGVYSRVTNKYGQRGNQYVHMEIGAVAENVYLQATSLGLATVFVGAFDEDDVQLALGTQKDEIPLCILPVGVK